MANYMPFFSCSGLYLIIVCCVQCDVQQPELINPSTNLTLPFNKYHDYMELTEFLTKFTDEYKNLTRLYTIGHTIKKRQLWVVEVHNMYQHQNSIRYGIPHVKVIGNIHGNEPAGREVILHMVEYLVKSYIHGDKHTRWLVDNTRIHLLPSLNPDGFEMSREGVCTSSRGRDNSKREDLNRNFPDYFRPNTRPLQLETEAIIKWLYSNTFVLSASLHGGSLVANYPFDSSSEDIWAPLYKLLNDANSSEEVIMLWKKLPHESSDTMKDSVLSPPPSPTPDNEVFQYLASLYARTHPTMHEGVVCKKGARSFKDGIVNGASWYPISGGMQDYNYFKHGCMELTLEITCCRYPNSTELKHIWEENKEALLMFISQAHRGVRGLVLDGNGKPISKAVLKVIGRNMTFNTSKNGEFWRVLLPGHYLLSVEASGYCQKIIPFQVPKVDNELMPVYANVNITLISKMNEAGSASKMVCPSVNINPDPNVGEPESKKSTSQSFTKDNFTNNPVFVVEEHIQKSMVKDLDIMNELIEDNEVKPEASTSSSSSHFLHLLIIIYSCLRHLVN